MTQGLWLSSSEFRSFAERNDVQLSGQIATRMAAGDMSSLFGLLPNPDPILKAMGRDMTVYRSLLVDPLVMGIRRRRISAVIALRRGFDATRSDASPRVRASVEKWFGTLNLQQLVRELMDGAFFGYRVGEVMWSMLNGMPAPSYVAKPSEWFGFDSRDGGLRFKAGGVGAGVAVDPSKFIVVGKMRSWENPYGEPDLAPCVWPVTFKRGGLKFWVTFTEKYGMPWAVGKLPRQAKETEVNDLAEKLARMVRDAVAVIPDDASVALIQPGNTASADMFQQLLMFCRSEISIALLGNNQSVEMESNKASAEAAGRIEDNLRDDDAEMVADGINQLVGLYCKVNHPGEVPPVYRFWEQEKIDEVRASRDEKLHQAGAVFSNNYFERTYGLRSGDLLPQRADPPRRPGRLRQDALTFSDGQAEQLVTGYYYPS